MFIPDIVKISHYVQKIRGGQTHPQYSDATSLHLSLRNGLFEMKIVYVYTPSTYDGSV